MRSDDRQSRIGLLLSGGLDSAILLGHLLQRGRAVQPFYIRSRLLWEEAELGAVRRYLDALRSAQLAPLVVLDLPLADVYGDHWSVSGRSVPDARTDDEAVYLPGRNALLVIKAALWCQLHGLGELALGLLGGNPFYDATDGFFADLESLLNRAPDGQIRILRPFARMDKRQVMECGRGLPLELTFSCIAPAGARHCGRCNKCAERQAAFRAAGLDDRTPYAASPS